MPRADSISKPAASEGGWLELYRRRSAGFPILLFSLADTSKSIEKIVSLAPSLFSGQDGARVALLDEVRYRGYQTHHYKKSCRAHEKRCQGIDLRISGAVHIAVGTRAFAVRVQMRTRGVQFSNHRPDRPRGLSITSLMTALNVDPFGERNQVFRRETVDHGGSSETRHSEAYQGGDQNQKCRVLRLPPGNVLWFHGPSVSLRPKYTSSCV